MSDNLSMDDQSKAPATGVSRRRLMRAGLSAAPVVMALKSNSVLATGTSGRGYCVKPSTFASLGAAAVRAPNASQAPRINTEYKCLSPDYWKGTNANLSPSNFKTTRFLSTTTTGFTLNPGGHYTNRSIQQVLDMSSSGNDHIALARNVIAAYLTARAFSGSAVLSVEDCKKIWNSGGNWSPVAGDTSNTWNQAKWLEYFKLLFG